jgi:rod shape determining protein RodA
VAIARSLRSSLHWPVILPASALILLGLLFLSGLTIRVGGTYRVDWHLEQLEGIALGLALALAVVLVPYKALVRHAYLFYAANLLLLVLVIVIGTERKNAQRWLTLFGFNFQPSELLKLTLVITLARFIRFRSSYKTFKGLGVPFLITLIPMALILKQPDLGTALLCIPILFTMLFVAGARARHLVLILVMGTLAILPVYLWGLEDYQRRRVDGFLAQLSIVKPAENEVQLERGTNFQVTSSKIAIGSGGITGVGLANGERESLYWVPERHNDFVFTVVGNEWGLFGGMLVLFFFGWILLSILSLAARHRDPAGRLLCVGVFALFGFQAFINVAMTVGLMPITGLTLPFLSYGRSSVIVSILAVAVVCNVAARPSYEFGRGF